MREPSVQLGEMVDIPVWGAADRDDFLGELDFDAMAARDYKAALVAASDLGQEHKPWVVNELYDLIVKHNPSLDLTRIDEHLATRLWFATNMQQGTRPEVLYGTG